MKSPCLFLVTRNDLSPGQQAVQAAHALRQFVADHPEQDSHWFRSSNTLVLLTVPDEMNLLRLQSKAFDERVRLSVFREPDRNNEVTAIALEPGQISKRLCRNLPMLS